MESVEPRNLFETNRFSYFSVLKYGRLFYSVFQHPIVIKIWKRFLTPYLLITTCPLPLPPNSSVKIIKFHFHTQTPHITNIWLVALMSTESRVCILHHYLTFTDCMLNYQELPIMIRNTLDSHILFIYLRHLKHHCVFELLNIM